MFLLQVSVGRCWLWRRASRRFCRAERCATFCRKNWTWSCVVPSWQPLVTLPGRCRRWWRSADATTATRLTRAPCRTCSLWWPSSVLKSEGSSCSLLPGRLDCPWEVNCSQLSRVLLFRSDRLFLMHCSRIRSRTHLNDLTCMYSEIVRKPEACLHLKQFFLPVLTNGFSFFKAKLWENVILSFHCCNFVGIRVFLCVMLIVSLKLSAFITIWFDNFNHFSYNLYQG